MSDAEEAAAAANESQGDFAAGGGGTRMPGGAAAADVRSAEGPVEAGAGAPGPAAAVGLVVFKDLQPGARPWGPRYSRIYQVSLLACVVQQMQGTLRGAARRGDPLMQDGTFERELKPIVDAALEKALRVERDETKGPRFFGSNGTMRASPRAVTSAPTDTMEPC